MAKEIIVNPVITIGGTDYSSQVTKATFDKQAADVETTNFGSGGYKERIGGIKEGSLNIEFAMDGDFSGLDAAMDAALGTVVAVTLKKENDTVAAGNPEHQFNVLVTNWSFLSGSVGDRLSNSVTWPMTGTPVRDIAP